MGWPQIVIIVLYAGSLIVNIIENPKSIMKTLATVALIFVCLFYGGFFK